MDDDSYSEVLTTEPTKKFVREFLQMKTELLIN